MLCPASKHFDVVVSGFVPKLGQPILAAHEPGCAPGLAPAAPVLTLRSAGRLLQV